MIEGKFWFPSAGRKVFLKGSFWIPSVGEKVFLKGSFGFLLGDWERGIFNTGSGSRAPLFLSVFFFLSSWLTT